MNPNYAKALLARGDLSYARASAANFDPKLLEDALKYYTLADIMPDQPEGAHISLKAHLAMANVMIIKAQQSQDPALFQQAEEYYMDVTQEYEQTLDSILRPDAAIAYFGLGSIYERQGKPEQALQAYQKAFSLADGEEYKATIQRRIEETLK